MRLIRNNQLFEYTVTFKPVTITARNEEEAMEKALEEGTVEPDDCVWKGSA